MTSAGLSAKPYGNMHVSSQRLSLGLATVAILVELTVSANLLTWLGIPYVSDGGWLPLKIHPGSYIIFLAFLVRLAERGTPLRDLRRMGWREPGVWMFVGAVLGAIIQTFALSGSGNVIVLLDTFLPAGLLGLCLADAPASALARLRQLMLVAFAGNAMLAIGESIWQFHLVPLYLNGQEYHENANGFRSTALYDHPLTGSAMTLLGALLRSRTDRPANSHFAYQLLMAGSLVAFGGRTASAVALIAAAAAIGWRVASVMVRRQYRTVHIRLFAKACLAIIMTLALVVFGGSFGTRLFGHLYWDASADVRLKQWTVLADLQTSQVLFGTSRSDLLDLFASLDLSYGVQVIENFWLLMFVDLGVFGFVVFSVGFAALFHWCWQRSDWHARAMLICLITVASASNSLGRKSTLLVVLMGAVISCPDPRRHAWETGLDRRALLLANDRCHNA